MSTAWIERQVEAENRAQAFGVYAHAIGGLEDMHAQFEVRDAAGCLIGFWWAAHGWDGQKPVEGWVSDPWEAAATAVREAIERLRTAPLMVLGLGVRRRAAS